MPKKDDRQIRQEFGVRRERQLLAMAVALLLVLFLALLYKRPVLGEISKSTIFGAQVIVISTFIGFTNFNWRCPSCNKFLGNDIGMQRCRKCGSRLR
jgi:hypothetical protein